MKKKVGKNETHKTKSKKSYSSSKIKKKKKALIFELGFYLGWQLKEWLLKLAYMGWCYDAIWLLKWAYVNWRERERERSEFLSH